MALLLVSCVVPCVAAAPNRGGRKGAGKRPASLQALFAARTEAAKATALIKLRKSITPDLALAIVQNEPSPWIAAMGVGMYLEGGQVDPQAAAVILHTFAQRPGMIGLAATFGATSGSAGPIAEELIRSDVRGKSADPKLLAATILATSAKMASEGAPVEGKAAGAGAPGKGGDKAGAGGRPGQGIAAAFEEPITSLLAERDLDVLEVTVLAAAWLQLESVKETILALDAYRNSGLLGAKLLYMARLGLDVPEEELREVFSTVPKPPGRYTGLSPGLSGYEVPTSGLCYGCEALGALGEAKYLDLLHTALANRDLRVQIEAAKAIEAIGSPESLPALLEKVESYRTPWPVLVFVLRAVGAIPARGSIPALIDRLGRETGRFRLDVTYALASIAGDQYAGTPEDWRTWWDDNRLTFEVDPQKTAAFRREFKVQDMRVESLGSFYDLDIYSDRVAFVLDTSMSMRGERINSLKVNLSQTLQTLNPVVAFNVVDFGGLITLMKPGALITAREIPLVIGKVQGMTLTLGTRSYDAMELAMLLPGVDTIIFLSDGAPVAGKFDDWSRIRTAIDVYNRYRPIAIYCLEFSAGRENLAAMEALSERNYGRTSSPQP